MSKRTAARPLADSEQNGDQGEVGAAAGQDVRPQPTTPRRRTPASTLTGRTEQDDPGAQAIHKFQRAANTEGRPAFDPFDAIAKPYDVRNDRQDAQALLQVPDNAEVVGCRSEAMVKDCGNGKGLTREQNALEWYIVDTLETPTTIGLGASQLRMEAAARLGVLQPAIDAAESADANNSLEKMLCHQLAALHHAGMGMLERVTNSPIYNQSDPAIATRYANAAARLFDSYQAGLLALLKFKTRGKQNVVVQHVHVSDGGQAVVAGAVGAGVVDRGDESK